MVNHMDILSKPSNKLIVINNKEIYNIISSVHVDQSVLERTEMAFDTYIHGNPLVRWLMWARLRATIDFAAIDKNSKVLDFGCGFGLLLPTLVTFAKKVYAIDLFPQYAKKLVERKHIDVNFIDSVSSVKDGSLNIIFATDVIEHLDNPQEVINMFKTKLAPNGKLIISGPTETIIYRIGRVLAGWHKKGEYHHRNIKDIEQICKNEGFKLLKAKKLPFSFLPPLFIILPFSR